MSRDIGNEKAAVWDQGTFAMLKEAKKKMGPDKLIIFNPLHGQDEKTPSLGQQSLRVLKEWMCQLLGIDMENHLYVDHNNREILRKTIRRMWIFDIKSCMLLIMNAIAV